MFFFFNLSTYNQILQYEYLKRVIFYYIFVTLASN